MTSSTGLVINLDLILVRLTISPLCRTSSYVTARTPRTPGVSTLVTPLFSLLDFLRTVSKPILSFLVLELTSTRVKVNFEPSTRRAFGLALSLSS